MSIITWSLPGDPPRRRGPRRFPEPAQLAICSSNVQKKSVIRSVLSAPNGRTSIGSSVNARPRRAARTGTRSGVARTMARASAERTVSNGVGLRAKTYRSCYRAGSRSRDGKGHDVGGMGATAANRTEGRPSQDRIGRLWRITTPGPRRRAVAYPCAPGYGGRTDARAGDDQGATRPLEAASHAERERLHGSGGLGGGARADLVGRLGRASAAPRRSPNPGDYLVRDLAGESIFVTRNAEASSTASTTCAATEGRSSSTTSRRGQRAQGVRVPVPRLDLRPERRLIGTPNVKEDELFDRGRATRCTASRSTTYAGFLFVNLARGTASLLESLNDGVESDRRPSTGSGWTSSGSVCASSTR